MGPLQEASSKSATRSFCSGAVANAGVSLQASILCPLFCEQPKHHLEGSILMRSGVRLLLT